MARFDRDTAVERVAGGCWRVRFDPAWWVVRGPNGGYVASIVVRAMRAELGQPERALRSLTVHYLAAPGEGEGEARVTVERSGRALSTVSARLEQGGRTVALALAAFATDYPGAAEYADRPPAGLPAPEDVPAPPDRGFDPPPFARNFALRPVVGGAPFAGGAEARTGGWIALEEERDLDEALLVTLTDAWLPAPFMVVDRPIAAPTIDLTVHVRAPLPRPHDFVYAEVRSATARAGFFEEDGRLFARDGTLLAHSRQLALIL